ncbi:maleylpyruvate isomerase [Crossiella equi]|uniref:Maleylpyruvate isomerase n=1 Tax=Crossiella equi TaxID=130796 RepID=A0ABS5A9Q8_9PSEU|nr:maleylpyruvate isomerase family mycothiol-dependent enzyme [Crossiella equi]MBP2473315.1 maleylpyruvate isomerase [Crossiella equi]
MPSPRRSPADAASRARAALDALVTADERLLTLATELGDAGARGASGLPGWSRGHLLTHLARNADALLNLLIWARTGVEHPMYASRADRDADIEQGAHRRGRLLLEDLIAASERFAIAARELPENAWTADVQHTSGTAFIAHEIPWLRLREVWVHLVDLDAGVSFTDIDPAVVPELIASSLSVYGERPGAPSLQVEVDLPSGQRVFTLSGDGDPSVVRGSGPDVLAWLTGRGDGTALSGTVPELPPWL